MCTHILLDDLIPTSASRKVVRSLFCHSSSSESVSESSPPCSTLAYAPSGCALGTWGKIGVGGIAWAAV